MDDEREQWAPITRGSGPEALQPLPRRLHHCTRAQGPSLPFDAPLGNCSLYTLRSICSLDTLPSLGTSIPSKLKLLEDLKPVDGP